MSEKRPDIKVWRIYGNAQVKDESHVLWPHRADGMQCTGYDGDVDAWSKHNVEVRGGCAQVVQRNGGPLQVIYKGTVDQGTINACLAYIQNRLPMGTAR